ncbi:putative transcriptional regulator containing an HTH domain fused to a Zn-ribbon [Thermococcus nautili]|uniref:Putative transcriptional regulator containing an HTH domain fused to a Zn-ribbon n=1 Tax=Thermococcus nautili TaxID=195522 RepID=W8P3D1_9EURY|nr:putative transcriptional regulator containing an HTH domain fused to a Zn-ribbon [Thermococcus nautili]
MSELAQVLGIRGRGSKKLILEDLKAIQKILRREGKVLLVKPAECRKCGFVFRPEINIPSRCPRCKSEWIEEPRFMIAER